MLGKMNSSAKTVNLPMKLQFSSFGVVYDGLRVFPNKCFGFRFLSIPMAVIQIFKSNAETIILVSPRKLHPSVALKRWNRLLQECMTSLVSLAAVIWVITAAKQTNQKLKITLKQ